MEDIKIGDKIICVDNLGFENELTKYKIYIVYQTKEHDGFYDVYITNDVKKLFGYTYRRFSTLNKYRITKLKEIYGRF